MRRQLSQSIVDCLAYIALVALLMASLFPLIWTLGIALTAQEQRIKIESLAEWRPTLENFSQVLRQPTFLTALINSAVISISSVVLALFLGAPAAYALARFSFRGSDLMLLTLITMRMLPPITLLLPMFVIFNSIGIANTRLGVVLAYTTFSLPVAVWILRGYFMNLPRELEECAWVDGAGCWRAFAEIVLPMSRPGLVAAAVLSLLIAWNDFLFAAVLTNSGTQTAPVLMATYAGDTGVEWGLMTASGILVVLPGLLFVFLLQKQMVAGLTADPTRER